MALTIYLDGDGMMDVGKSDVDTQPSNLVLWHRLETGSRQVRDQKGFVVRFRFARLTIRLWTAQAFCVARELAEKPFSSSTHLLVSNDDQQRPRPRNRHIEEVGIAFNEVDGACLSSARDDRGQDHHVALIPLKAMRRVGDNLVS